MTGAGGIVLRIARWIAGLERAEWIDAMTAEAATIHGDSTGWALGCVWAALKDRVSREWRLLAAALLLPACVLGLQALLFFPIVEFSDFAGLPTWTFIPVFLLMPLPFAFVLGRLRPGLAAYVVASASFVIMHMFPIALVWIATGTSPLLFFGDKGHWYNMSPAAGLSCALLVWLAGVWFGSRSKRASAS